MLHQARLARQESLPAWPPDSFLAPYCDCLQKAPSLGTCTSTRGSFG